MARHLPSGPHLAGEAGVVHAHRHVSLPLGAAADDDRGLGEGAPAIHLQAGRQAAAAAGQPKGSAADSVQSSGRCDEKQAAGGAAESACPLATTPMAVQPLQVLPSCCCFCCIQFTPQGSTRLQPQAWGRKQRRAPCGGSPAGGTCPAAWAAASPPQTWSTPAPAPPPAAAPPAPPAPAAAAAALSCPPPADCYHCRCCWRWLLPATAAPCRLLVSCGAALPRLPWEAPRQPYWRTPGARRRSRGSRPPCTGPLLLPCCLDCWCSPRRRNSEGNEQSTASGRRWLVSLKHAAGGCVL